MQDEIRPLLDAMAELRLVATFVLAASWSYLAWNFQSRVRPALCTWYFELISYFDMIYLRVLNVQILSL